MTTRQARRGRRPRFELRRMMLGAVLEIFFKAWAAAAAIAISFSDAHSWAGKMREGLLAAPTLADEYRRTRYVVEHREQLESAIDYLNTQTPSQAELETSIERSQATLDRLQDFDRRMAELLDPDFVQFWKNFGDIREAWRAIPERESVHQLIDLVGPAVEHAQLMVPVYYGGLLALTDNYARDERTSTIAAIAVLGSVLFMIGRTVAFAVRRGRPGFIARALQWLGAHAFPRWYSRNVAYALNSRLYEYARRDVHDQLVANPETELDQESFEKLEAYFADRAGRR